MTHKTTTHSQTSPASKGNLIILLGAPSHDNLTEYTSKLLEDFPDLGAPTLLCRIETPVTYDTLLAQKSIDPSQTEVVLIYCGHGEPPSLQGPGALPGTPNCRDLQSVFYDERFLHLGPTFVLAFCCSAAIDLGYSIDRKTTGRTFVGFDEQIGWVMKTGDYADCYKRILHGSALAMLRATTIHSLEKSIREIYRAALSSFSSEKDGQYEWGLMMRAYLRKQLEALTFIRS